MTEVKDSSSLPLLLGMTGAVLAVVIGGWFYLNRDSSADAPVAEVQEAAPADESPEAAVEADAPVDAPQTASNPDAPDVDAELRKARLAADADILVFPATQSALYYYGRVLRAEPQNAVANAELDVVLAKVERTVMEHLAAGQFDNAYEIAMLVARHRPEHALVTETQQALDTYTEELVAQAIQHAQDGDDTASAEALATAAALPGRNPDYFTAVSSSIGEIQEVRRAAEQDRAQRARLAADEARAAWADSIRKAIMAGNLVTPAGASARDLLAEDNAWDSERQQLTVEVSDALIAAAVALIDEVSPGEAEPLVAAAIELGGDGAEIEELQAALDGAYIQEQSNRIAAISELVRVKTVPPRYPRRAQERDISGWVDVFFTVTPSGETSDVVVNRSDPESIFDRAAIEAVEKWAFEPVEYRGQIISQRAGTRVVFRLE